MLNRSSELLVANERSSGLTVDYARNSEFRVVLEYWVKDTVDCKDSSSI